MLYNMFICNIKYLCAVFWVFQKRSCKRMFNSHGRTYYNPFSYTNDYGVRSAAYSTGGDRLFGDQLSVEFVGGVLFDSRDYTSAPMGTYSSIGSSVGTVSYSGGVVTSRTSNNILGSYGTDTIPGFFSVSRTVGRLSYHSSDDVLQSSLPSISSASYATNDSRGGRPGSGATGELNPEFASPVGDVLLPMLLMVGVYAVVKWFKKRKFQKSLSI